MYIKSLLTEKRNGFTLVEMVIVVTVLGILSGIGFMEFGNVQEISRKNADYIAAANLATAANLCLGESSSIIEYDNNSKVIKINKLKEKGYINSIPKSQSQNKEFVIKFVEVGTGENKSEELRIVCYLEDGKEEVFYPKPE